MYAPRAFRETSRERLYGLIEAHNFGLLITGGSSQPQVTHLPFLLRRNPARLLAHFARANLHWRDISPGDRVLCTFQGPHAYISPGWYERQDTVLTWNYAAVHVYGRIELLTGKEDIQDIVLELSDTHERQLADPWIPDYYEALLNAIIGFRFLISDIQGKYKLSQNKTAADREGAIEALRESGSENEIAIAALMEQTLITHK